jgi:hypothetical protein
VVFGLVPIIDADVAQGAYTFQVVLPHLDFRTSFIVNVSYLCEAHVGSG